MKTVTLYTDGACSGNPGPGGWGAILEYMGHEREMSGGEKSTTNNRMELTAVIEGLKALKESCVVELYSDSKYVIDGLSKGWAAGWQKNGWIKSDKKPALNPDLWEILLELTAPYVKVGGKVLAMKGTAAEEELSECENAIRQLGLKLEGVKQFPIDGTAHTVIVLKKVKPTPPKYPRRFAKIKQSPL